jgi:hypothetical protein
MKVITSEQSGAIAREIFYQAWALDDLAAQLAPPWGEAGRNRLERLARQRLELSMKPIPE